MTQEEKVRFLSRLLRATVEGKVLWSKLKPFPDLTEKGNLTSAVYGAEIESSRLRLYRVAGRQAFWSEGEEEILWIRRIILEIRDPDGDSVMEIDQYGCEIVIGLFDAVRERVSPTITDIRKRFDLVAEHVP